MPSKHTTRSGIADEVEGVEYTDTKRDGPYLTETREREFTKPELVAIHNHLYNGLFVDLPSLKAVHHTGLDTKVKPAVRDAIRRVMDEEEYRGFGEENHDGNPLRSRELLTILTGVKDASENLRWESVDE